ncbi:hypothetical protein HYX13_01080 [Candidatus Woesearchaeota archaeon]|nr:hypothetical protein [Candidatus Woesearchaeota archaeon]
MAEYLTEKEAFLKCKKEGKLFPTEGVDTERIIATLAIAEGDVETVKHLKKTLPQESIQWSSVFKLGYDALHGLTEAFLQFEQVKSENHQCLFAYLCEKHPELDFSWDFLEKVRTKRNGVHYYGTPVTYRDWKEVELQFFLYINKLKEEVSAKIKKWKPE